jgi:DnaJ-class molecular chaperone
MEKRNERISPQGYPIWDEDCPRCGGTGTRITFGRKVKCIPCDGTGIVVKSDHPDTL